MPVGFPMCFWCLNYNFALFANELIVMHTVGATLVREASTSINICIACIIGKARWFVCGRWSEEFDHQRIGICTWWIWMSVMTHLIRGNKPKHIHTHTFHYRSSDPDSSLWQSVFTSADARAHRTVLTEPKNVISSVALFRLWITQSLHKKKKKTKHITAVMQHWTAWGSFKAGRCIKKSLSERVKWAGALEKRKSHMFSHGTKATLIQSSVYGRGRV